MTLAINALCLFVGFVAGGITMGLLSMAARTNGYGAFADHCPFLSTGSLCDGLHHDSTDPECDLDCDACVSDEAETRMAGRMAEGYVAMRDAS